MKRVHLLFTMLLLFSSFPSWAQYPYKWSVGGTMGLGATIGYGEPGFTMSATIGFNKVIKETNWRWGVDAGIMNHGIADYLFEDDEPDKFIRSNYEYIGVVVDYSLFFKNNQTIFARGGLAPAHRSDMYIRHSEDKFTGMGIIGMGLDFDFSRFIINGYIDPRGCFVLMFSYGWWFGKQMTPWW